MMKGEERQRGMKGENGSYRGGTLLTRLCECLTLLCPTPTPVAQGKML